jgi:protein arginine kinase activator
MKCQRCPQAATLHITEIVSEDQVEEMHLCEKCAHEYLYEPQQKQAGKSAAPSLEEGDEPAVMNRECEVCGIKFVDFRNTGRLGCPHDYVCFKRQLEPLIVNIHGETAHTGKRPRRGAGGTESQTELIRLRRKMKEAVAAEDYEEASRLRDEIRRVENSSGK